MNSSTESMPVPAVMAYGLMLLNLLFPIVMYFMLLVVWQRHRHSPDRLLFMAVNQSWLAATLSTCLFISANVLIITLAQYQSTFALITFELYFIGVVPIFLIPGLLGLVKSLSHEVFTYPLVGGYYQTQFLSNQAEEN